MSVGPRNPFLADSDYAVAHGRSDQQDNSAARGPSGPTVVLSDDDIQHTWLGPGHFGSLISGPDEHGRRVIWSNGRNQVAKLDYETLEVLATRDTGVEGALTEAECDAIVAGLDQLSGQEAIEHAMTAALTFMTGLEGVYALLDCDHTLFLGRGDGAVAYVEADPDDRRSPIVERDRWTKPAEIEGRFVGINMTFDGRLVMTTDHGWVVCLARDFSTHDAIRLPGADAAAAHCAAQEAEYGHTGFGWVRTSTCVGDDGGIYVSSVDTHHKVVWTGRPPVG